jgi:hypothetical protein
MVAESWDKTTGFERFIACGVSQFDPHMTTSSIWMLGECLHYTVQRDSRSLIEVSRKG